MEQGLSALERRIEIRWSDLDSSRHVNNAVYLSYLEEARTAWLAEALRNTDAPNDFVLVRIEIDYRRELTLEDEFVLARCELLRVGTSSVSTTEQIVAGGGELAAEAQAVSVARDGQSGRSRPLTAPERAALEA